MTETFRLAHFSDAHLAMHGRFRFGELVSKRGLSALNWARNRHKRHLVSVADALRADIIANAPDHVAMTGDAVNFGLPREFAAAAEWLAGFGGGDRLSFVPGNHEAIVAGVEAEREAAYAPFTCGEDGAPGWPWLRRRGGVALIGVSTCIATRPFFAQGEVGAPQIERLAERLNEAADAFRVVLIHHPPTDITKPRKHLRDAAAVRAAIAEAGAEVVLHGHNHRNETSWIDAGARRIPVLGVPAASVPVGAAIAPAEWRMLEITPATGAMTVRRRVIGEDGAFHDAGAMNLT